MLRQVFNGVSDEEIDKIKILQEMVDELNRIHDYGQAMYIHIISLILEIE
ncbi:MULTISPECIES: hypothetical protein [unclassified Campylobacter]|nr:MULTISPECIES: hypothetical protein [unclassified Campylobacter]